LTVSGIVKDWAANTDFPYTDFISFSTINVSFLRKDIHLDDWGTTDIPENARAFVRLAKGGRGPQSTGQWKAGNHPPVPRRDHHTHRLRTPHGNRFGITVTPLNLPGVLQILFTERVIATGKITRRIFIEVSETILLPQPADPSHRRHYQQENDRQQNPIADLPHDKG
jgi:hypothetical protein